MTQNPKNKNLPAPKIDIRNQPAFFVADVKNDAGSHSVGAAESLPQILKVRPVRATRDPVPGIQRCRPLGMVGCSVPNLLPA
jgi:hypothetical protein